MIWKRANIFCLGVIAFLLLPAFAPGARAQAWVPPQGEGSVSVMFQDVFIKYHSAPTVRVDNGHVRQKALLVDVTYGVTDKLAISFSIPWMATKYNGRNPHPLSLTDPTPNPLDDGRYHSTVQDFRFDVRYNVMRKGLVLTPFIATNRPSHDYTYFAHAAPGRNLKELEVGVSAAKLLDMVLPGLFVQGRYAYGIVEKVVDISHNRSTADVEVGYFVTPRLRLLALSSGQLTHGGVDFVRGLPLAQRGPLWVFHDQVSRVNSLNVGGGATYALSETVDVFGALTHAVAQRNGHMIDRGLNVGLSWGFSTARTRMRAVARAERSLVKCVCEKRAM